VRAQGNRRDTAAVEGEGRLPVCTCRQKTKAAKDFHLAMEGVRWRRDRASPFASNGGMVKVASALRARRSRQDLSLPKPAYNGG